MAIPWCSHIRGWRTQECVVLHGSCICCWTLHLLFGITLVVGSHCASKLSVLGWSLAPLQYDLAWCKWSWGHACIVLWHSLCIELARTIYIYTVYIQCFWQGNHQIYGQIQCIYTVLANPIYVPLVNSYSGRADARHSSLGTGSEICYLHE